MIDPASTRPSARGRLSVTPIAELLVLALQRKLSGSFVFETPDKDKSAFFVDLGRVTKVRTAEPVEPLGHVLVDSGLLDHAGLAAGLLLARRRQHRLGDTLVQLRAVDRPALEQGLVEQLARRLSWLGRLPPASIFGYYGNLDLLEDRPPCVAEPLSLVWRSIRDAATAHPRQDVQLAALGNRALGMHADATPERFGLSADEQTLVDTLRSAPQTMRALLSLRIIDEQRARRLIYALLLTRQLDLGSDVRATDSIPPRSSLTMPSSDRIEQALERASRSGREQERPRDSAAAVQAFHRAQLCIAKKQFAEAERFARQACVDDPGSAEYLALHAWLRMHGGELSTPAHATQIMGALDRAVMKARDSVSIRFYRAQVLKRLGRDDEAFKDFRFVARHQPDNLDAVREVRLHMMRTRNKEKTSGVFSRLFLR